MKVRLQETTATIHEESLLAQPKDTKISDEVVEHLERLSEECCKHYTLRQL